MKPEQFLKSVHQRDRACEAVVIDSPWKSDSSPAGTNSGVSQFVDIPNNHGWVREFSRGFLGVNQLPIDPHFKNASSHRDESQLSNLPLEFEQFIRQTDGMWFVVSHGTIFDSYFHCLYTVLDSSCGST